MNELAASSRRARLLARAAGIFVAVQHGLTVVTEALFSRKGLALGCLVWLAVLTTSGWIVPPLSPKLSALHLPLRFVLGGGPLAEDLLYAPRRVMLGSLGTCLLFLYIVAMVAVFFRPSRLPKMAGLLFSVVIAANALLLGNHPELIELIRSENGQQKRIVAMMQTEYPATLSEPHRVPIEEDALAVRVSLSSLSYLGYGVWSAFLLALVMVFASERPLPQRLGAFTGFALLGMLLAVLGGVPQVWGQWDLLRAQRAQMRGRIPEARQFLEKTTAKNTDFARLKAVLLLRGRLDFEDGLSTPVRNWWEATQWEANGVPARAEVLLDGLNLPNGNAGLNRQTAALLTQIGLDYQKKGWTGAALDRWQAAQVMSRVRLENRFYGGFVEAQWERARPEYCRAALDPLLAWTADRPLRADFLAYEGDVLVAAGKINEARDCYLRSMILFNLPKTINYRAQKGLGGM